VPGDGKKSTAERELAIQQIVSRAVVSTEIVDIMKAAGLESPDISILSDEFLAEVRDSDKKNLAIEALKKLINGDVRSQSKRNVTLPPRLHFPLFHRRQPVPQQGVEHRVREAVREHDCLGDTEWTTGEHFERSVPARRAGSLLLRALPVSMMLPSPGFQSETALRAAAPPCIPAATSSRAAARCPSAAAPAFFRPETR
jgi:hypothetical protein